MQSVKIFQVIAQSFAFKNNPLSSNINNGEFSFNNNQYIIQRNFYI